MMTIDRVEEFRRQYNNTGIYLTAYRYQNKEQQGELWANHLYHDFDSDGLMDPQTSEETWQKIIVDVRHAISVYEVFYGIPARYIEFYFSGKKGISMLVPAVCLGYQPNEHLNMIFREMVMEVVKYTPSDTLDTRIYDRIRLWRIVNSQHEKSGFYKVPLSYKEITELTFAQISELAKVPREIERSRPVPVPKAIKRTKDIIKNFNPNKGAERLERTIKFVPPCIEHLLNTDIEHGGRNNTAAALASFWRQHGLSLEEAMEKMKDWNNRCSLPPMDGAELHNTTRSVFRNGKTWGCSSLRELSKCELAKCKFGKKGDR